MKSRVLFSTKMVPLSLIHT